MQPSTITTILALTLATSTATVSAIPIAMPRLEAPRFDYAPNTDLARSNPAVERGFEGSIPPLSHAPSQ